MIGTLVAITLVSLMLCSGLALIVSPATTQSSYREQRRFLGIALVIFGGFGLCMIASRNVNAAGICLLALTWYTLYRRFRGRDEPKTGLYAHSSVPVSVPDKPLTAAEQAAFEAIRASVEDI